MLYDHEKDPMKAIAITLTSMNFIGWTEEVIVAWYLENLYQ